MLLSTVLSSVFLASLDAEINEKRGEVAELEQGIALIWDNCQLADLRETFISVTRC